MHHVALDGPRPHDRNFNDEIVKSRGLEARQHRHLRARFNLKAAHGVRCADHGVGRRVLGGDGRGTISLVATKFEAAGLIHTHRGKIELLDCAFQRS
jgi:hypothetical protein